MVAQTIELPNLRKMFIPDEGYTIIDADLAKADVQVVAWEADDEVLKQMFREGVNLHEENAKVIYNTTKPTKEQYNKAKAGVHATDYDVNASTLKHTLNSTQHEAELFIKAWFSAHPKIKDWQTRVETTLRQTKTVTNAFGYRYYFFDRIIDQWGKLNKKLFHEALAWSPQSTVAIVTNYGLLNIEENLPQVELLLQVHDSLVMQAPTSLCPGIFSEILTQMDIEVPFDDPLHIPVFLAVSEKSWGHIEDVEVVKDI